MSVKGDESSCKSQSHLDWFHSRNWKVRILKDDEAKVQSPVNNRFVDEMDSEPTPAPIIHQN